MAFPWVVTSTGPVGGGLWLCVYFMTGTPEGSTESGFMEKPGIEPAIGFTTRHADCCMISKLYPTFLYTSYIFKWRVFMFDIMNAYDVKIITKVSSHFYDIGVKGQGRISAIWLVTRTTFIMLWMVFLYKTIIAQDV